MSYLFQRSLLQLDEYPKKTGMSGYASWTLSSLRSPQCHHYVHAGLWLRFITSLQGNNSLTIHNYEGFVSHQLYLMKRKYYVVFFCQVVGEMKNNCNKYWSWKLNFISKLNYYYLSIFFFQNFVKQNIWPLHFSNLESL